MFQSLWDIPSFILRFLYVTVINKKWIYIHVPTKINNNKVGQFNDKLNKIVNDVDKVQIVP